MTHISISEWDENDEAVCRCDLFIENGNGTIANLFTQIPYRHRGLATKILQSVERIAVGLGIKTLMLRVAKRTFMMEWYERSGYIFFADDEENTSYKWLKKEV